MDLLNTISEMLTLSTLATPASAAADAAESAEPVKNIWDFIVAGGVLMIPIGICSLVALGVVAERLTSLQRSRIIPPNFMDGLGKALKGGKGNADKALAYCRENESPVANIFAAGLKRMGAPLEIMEKHIADAGDREVLKLRKFLRVLSVIAAVTPLMGLLGTIFGMIKAFQKVATSGETLGKAELLAEGIYEAMVTTAAGLTVAIPVLICFHFIASRIDKLVMDMDQMSVDFLEDYVEGVEAKEAERAPKKNESKSGGDAKVATA